MPKIIDSHCHFLPDSIAKHTSFFKNGWSDIGQLNLSRDNNEIANSLLVYPTSDAHLQMGGWQNVCDIYNEEIASFAKSSGGKFIGAGILPMDTPENFTKELLRIKKLGLKVLSLASSYNGIYLSDKIFDPIFKFSEENNIPIFVHSQIINPIGEERVRDPLLSPVLEYVFDVSMCVGKLIMEGTLLKYKGLKIIFAHYGGVIPFVKERFDSTYLMLRKRDFVKDLGILPSEYFKKLFFDTSGSRSIASLLCMLEAVDSSHILFGSDFPANQDISSSIKSIQRSSLSEKDKENILDNSLFKSL
ncbi:MAG: amidohydrolase family protein [Candidatus Omnitrophica bacterium]|nr:amidohydrolase family protein [Candidatus Omnitrophota bacterium]